MIALLSVLFSCLVAFASWYSFRCLTDAFRALKALAVEQERQIKDLREDLEQERSERKQTEDAQAQWCLLLAERLSELQTKPRGQLVLFAPPSKDRN